jgi:hypothetical protein
MHVYLLLPLIERHGRVINTVALFSGGSVFEARPGARSSRLGFVVLSSVAAIVP